MTFFEKQRARFRSYTRQEKIVLPISYVFLFIWALWTLVPTAFCILNSVKDIHEFYDNPLGLPSYIKWENFRLAFQLEYRNCNVIEMLFNSIIFVVTFTFANVGASMLTAYVLARYEFRGKNFLYSLAIIVQILPIFGTTGSGYLIADKLGLVDNIWMVWVTALNGFDMQFLIMYSYFVNIDKAYAEAARIDGASQFTIFWKIMVPMIMQPIMVMTLSSVLGHWNNYTTSLIYFPNHPTLTTGIFSMQKRAQYVEGGITAFLAAVLLAMVPVVVFFLATNRKIFKIDVQGGVKG